MARFIGRTIAFILILVFCLWVADFTNPEDPTPVLCLMILAALLGPEIYFPKKDAS